MFLPRSVQIQTLHSALSDLTYRLPTEEARVLVVSGVEVSILNAGLPSTMRSRSACEVVHVCDVGYKYVYSALVCVHDVFPCR